MKEIMNEKVFILKLLTRRQTSASTSTSTVGDLINGRAIEKENLQHTQRFMRFLHSVSFFIILFVSVSVNKIQQQHQE